MSEPTWIDVKLWNGTECIPAKLCDHEGEVTIRFRARDGAELPNTAVVNREMFFFNAPETLLYYRGEIAPALSPIGERYQEWALWFRKAPGWNKAKACDGKPYRVVNSGGKPPYERIAFATLFKDGIA